MSGQSQKNQGHIGFCTHFEELFINTLSMQNDVVRMISSVYSRGPVLDENCLVVRHQSLQKLVLNRVDLVSGCLGAPRAEGRQSQAGCLSASLVGQHMASKWTPACSSDHQWLHVPLERMLSGPAQSQMTNLFNSFETGKCRVTKRNQTR